MADAINAIHFSTWFDFTGLLNLLTLPYVPKSTLEQQLPDPGIPIASERQWVRSQGATDDYAHALSHLNHY